MSKNIYMIGTPGSGKSTFIAALGYSLVNGYGIDLKYQIGNITELDYVSQLIDKWSMSEMLERTKKNEKNKIYLPLLDSEGKSIEIIIPDQSGEAFRKMVTSRNVENEIFDGILESESVLLFVNPSKIKPHVLITDISEELRNEHTEDIKVDGDFLINEQAEYVELLQFLTEIKENKVKVKIIISAWDVYNEYSYPSDLLKEKMPLMWQFIETNKEKYEITYWGVSAQGGSLEDDKQKKCLKQKINPMEKIIVVGENGERSNDLTKILE